MNKNVLILNFNIYRPGTMAIRGKKSFFSRLLRIGVLFRYLGESAGVVMQGATFRDKLILFSYYLKIPAIVVKSMRTGKSFRELEEEKRFLTKNVTIKNSFGKFYCGNNILTVYMVDKNTEKHLYPHIEITKGIFIDVGAHIGKYSIAASKNAETMVVAIEPDEYNFGLLKKNVALNKRENIICIDKGAFSSAGEIPFFITGRGEGMHSVYRQPESQEEKSIRVDTIDNIIDELQLKTPVSLIKIDVEGAEREVLQGAEKIIQKDRPNLIIETWENNPERLTEIKAYLQRFGYEKAQLLDAENIFFSTR